MTDRIDQTTFVITPAGSSTGKLWGARHRDRTIACGLFLCPDERLERAYWTHRVRNWFHVLSVPVVPGAKIGEYVECFACGASYHPGVLRAGHPALGNVHTRS